MLLFIRASDGVSESYSRGCVAKADSVHVFVTRRDGDAGAQQTLKDTVAARRAACAGEVVAVATDSAERWLMQLALLEKVKPLVVLSARA
jgi:hypothetical protein